MLNVNQSIGTVSELLLEKTVLHVTYIYSLLTHFWRLVKLRETSLS